MRHRPAQRRGSTLTLAIIVTFVLTGLIITLAWMTGEQTQRTAGLKQTDQAFFAAEAGAQRVQWYCKTGRINTLTQPLQGSLNSYNYSVTWTALAGSAINVRSVGTAGAVSYVLSETITPPSSAPALAAGGNFDNKNIDIVGNITVTSYDNAGSGSLTGNLTYYSSALNTGTVTGTVTKASGAFSPIDFDALGNALVNAAGKTYTGDQSGVTFDFNALSGSNRVIYVAGNVVNPTFVGSGTLYATGSVTFGSIGTAANPVNIVARGDITTNNNVTIFGSLFTAGNWYRGKFALTGLAYVAKDVDTSNYAQSTFVAGSPPWFDPRAPGWSALTSVTDFSGPQP